MDSRGYLEIAYQLQAKENEISNLEMQRSVVNHQIDKRRLELQTECEQLKLSLLEIKPAGGLGPKGKIKEVSPEALGARMMEETSIRGQ